MSLLEKIKNDALTARKARNTLASELLVTLASEATMVGKNAGRETSDSEAIAVVKKFVKNAEETLKALSESDARRHNTILEIGILNEYLPKQMSEAELTKAVADIVFEKGLDRSKPMVGVVMKELKAKYDGQYDGKLASTVVNVALTLPM